MLVKSDRFSTCCVCQCPYGLTFTTQNGPTGNRTLTVCVQSRRAPIITTGPLEPYLVRRWILQCTHGRLVVKPSLAICVSSTRIYIVRSGDLSERRRAIKESNPARSVLEANLCPAPDAWRRKLKSLFSRSALELQTHRVGPPGFAPGSSSV